MFARRRRRPSATRLATALLAAGLLGGCATPAGPIFPPVAGAPAFPPPPDTPRVRYVGSLGTEADLKPGVSALDGLGQAIFGKPSVRSMLAPYAVVTVGERVFVCDGAAQTLHVFDLATRAYAQWRPGEAKEPPASDGTAPANHHLRFSQPVGITADPSGRIYVADSVAAVLFVFDQNGQCIGDLGYGTLKRPCGVAYDRLHDRLLVTDSAHHQLLALALDGTLLQAVGTRGMGPGEFNFPTNVTIDADGRVYVSDTLNFRVQAFDAELRPTATIGRLGDMPGYFAQPKGIAVDSEHHLYVVDAQFEAVQVFAPDGTLLMTFGQEGSGPGEFWLPAGIFIDVNDRIWIADSYNRRVQVFDYLREAPPTEAVPAAAGSSSSAAAPSDTAPGTSAP